MIVTIENADRPCPKCARPLNYFTLSRSSEEESLSITLIGCQTCGIPDWQVASEILTPIRSQAA